VSVANERNEHGARLLYLARLLYGAGFVAWSKVIVRAVNIFNGSREWIFRAEQWVADGLRLLCWPALDGPENRPTIPLKLATR